MARRTRCADAGYVYHVLSRAVGRARLFAKSADYAVFERILHPAWERLRAMLSRRFADLACYLQ
ncbi:MAG TPA: hypothetical protein VK395_01700 [Gemmataceae bacterium]|nr:hypothetical protein [Gemmataceae bacterium]